MLKLVTPPATPVVSLAEIKSHVRVYHSDEDSYLESLIAAAQGLIDGADGWLNRALVDQSWEYSIDRFPSTNQIGKPERVRLPLAPLISVEAVEYTAADGTNVTLDDFRVFGVGSSQAGYILPAINTSWPSTLCEPESVRISFTAGYADGVPQGVKHAIMLLVGHWFEHREAATDVRVADLPIAVNALLFPYRNWSF